MPPPPRPQASTRTRPRGPSTRRARRFGTRLAAATLALPLAGCGLAAAPTSQATPDPTPVGAVAHGRLVFHDEFDGTSLGSSWTPHRDGAGDGPGAPFNPTKEDAAFDPAQVSVGGGDLRLHAQPRATTVAGTTYADVSGVVQSRGHVQVHFGYVEFRLKTPADTGYWPAAWLVGVDNPVAEIDVVEFAHADDGHYGPLSNLHWGSDWDHAHQWGWQPLGSAQQSYAGAWHTFGLRWDRGRMQTYLDGRPGPVMTGAAVPDQPMYLVLNLSVTKGARPPADDLLVDYVRVWS